MLSNLLVVSAAVLLNGRTAAAQKPSASPCAAASSMSAAYISKFPEATQALIPVSAAEACLKSVKVRDDDDKLIEEMVSYISWQSNLAYLKDPPEEYKEDRLDIEDEITKIYEGVKNGSYEDEWTVMTQLSTTLTRAYDFHLSFIADIMNIMRFRRGNIGKGLEDDFSMISVSSDGKALPELFNYFDIMFSDEEGWTPSPISEINNQSAVDYIQEYSKLMVYHEDHARYNQLFPSQPEIAQGSTFSPWGRSRMPDGDYTFVKYKNGTEIKYINNAVLNLDLFDGIESGEDLFAAYCNQPPKTTNSKLRKRYNPYTDMVSKPATKVKRVPAVPSASAEPTATGFPTPEILHSEVILGGYYLSGQGYDDVAVMSVPSFSPMEDAAVEEFQDIVGSFLKSATDAGKKRLVIDIRGNGGGYVNLGYDMFKQLFPDMDPYGASRFRANEAFDSVGQFFTAALKDVTYDIAVENANKLGNAYKSIFNYKLPNTIDNKNFTSWQDYFGPHVFNNDNFTSVQRQDLNNFFSDDLNLDITGYRTRADKLAKKQPFESKNIVLLQDGGCGSTCAVFTEFMKTQGGVQQVVVGGRPETGPMQGVGGSKGSQVFYWTQVQAQGVTVSNNVLPEDEAEFNKTDVAKLVSANRPIYRSAKQPSGMTVSNINLRDNIRMGDDKQTPLEFVYEAADCRLFYTADMVRNVTNVWKKTVDAFWGDKNKYCVDGSLNQKSSLSGGAATQGGDNNAKLQPGQNPGQGQGGKDNKQGAAASVSISATMMVAILGVAGLMAML